MILKIRNRAQYNPETRENALIHVTVTKYADTYIRDIKEECKAKKPVKVDELFHFSGNGMRRLEDGRTMDQVMEKSKIRKRCILSVLFNSSKEFGDTQPDFFPTVNEFVAFVRGHPKKGVEMSDITVDRLLELDREYRTYDVMTPDSVGSFVSRYRKKLNLHDTLDNPDIEGDEFPDLWNDKNTDGTRQQSAPVSGRRAPVGVPRARIPSARAGAVTSVGRTHRPRECNAAAGGLSSGQSSSFQGPSEDRGYRLGTSADIGMRVEREGQHLPDLPGLDWATGDRVEATRTSVVLEHVDPGHAVASANVEQNRTRRVQRRKKEERVCDNCDSGRWAELYCAECEGGLGLVLCHQCSTFLHVRRHHRVQDISEAPKVPKRYVPHAYRAPFAILVGLFRGHNLDPPALSMTEDELRIVAQELTDTDLSCKTPGKYFGGFDSIESLITRGLIRREATTTPSYALRENGIASGQRLLTFHDAVSTFSQQLAVPSLPAFSDQSFEVDDGQLIVLIDVREKQKERLIQMAAEKGIVCEVRDLPCGDYLWIIRGRDGSEEVLPHVVERKMWDDLGNSLADNRFMRQINKMKRSGFSDTFYLLEGSMLDMRNKPDDEKRREMLQCLEDAVCLHGCKVNYTSSWFKSAHWLIYLTSVIKASYQCELRRELLSFAEFTRRVKGRGVLAPAARVPVCAVWNSDQFTDLICSSKGQDSLLPILPAARQALGIPAASNPKEKRLLVIEGMEAYNKHRQKLLNDALKEAFTDERKDVEGFVKSVIEKNVEGLIHHDVQQYHSLSIQVLLDVFVVRTESHADTRHICRLFSQSEGHTGIEEHFTRLPAGGVVRGKATANEDEHRRQRLAIQQNQPDLKTSLESEELLLNEEQMTKLAIAESLKTLLVSEEPVSPVPSPLRQQLSPAVNDEHRDVTNTAASDVTSLDEDEQLRRALALSLAECSGAAPESAGTERGHSVTPTPSKVTQNGGGTKMLPVKTEPDVIALDDSQRDGGVLDAVEEQHTVGLRDGISRFDQEFGSLHDQCIKTEEISKTEPEDVITIDSQESVSEENHKPVDSYSVRTSHEAEAQYPDLDADAALAAKLQEEYNRESSMPQEKAGPLGTHHDAVVAERLQAELNTAGLLASDSEKTKSLRDGVSKFAQEFGSLDDLDNQFVKTEEERSKTEPEDVITIDSQESVTEGNHNPVVSYSVRTSHEAEAQCPDLDADAALAAKLQEEYNRESSVPQQTAGPLGTHRDAVLAERLQAELRYCVAEKETDTSQDSEIARLLQSELAREDCEIGVDLTTDEALAWELQENDGVLPGASQASPFRSVSPLKQKGNSLENVRSFKQQKASNDKQALNKQLTNYREQQRKKYAFSQTTDVFPNGKSGSSRKRPSAAMSSPTSVEDYSQEDSRKFRKISASAVSDDDGDLKSYLSLPSTSFDSYKQLDDHKPEELTSPGKGQCQTMTCGACGGQGHNRKWLNCPLYYSEEEERRREQHKEKRRANAEADRRERQLRVQTLETQRQNLTENLRQTQGQFQDMIGNISALIHTVEDATKRRKPRKK